MPSDYPISPPKVCFRTRIWHPNVEEVSGNVCVDTLKKDWCSSLTLRDVLLVSSEFSSSFLCFIWVGYYVFYHFINIHHTHPFLPPT